MAVQVGSGTFTFEALETWERLPARGSLTGVAVRARVFARSSGLSDGGEVAVATQPSSEWAAPPPAATLDARATCAMRHDWVQLACSGLALGQREC